jgi:serine/threonine-protein kinase ATR
LVITVSRSSQVKLKVDTLRTHIRGVLSRNPQWSKQLASFEVEAAWIIGDWTTVRSAATGSPIAQVLLDLHDKPAKQPRFAMARAQLGQGIASDQYSRVHEVILQLHMLREIELIHDVDNKLSRTRHQANQQVIDESTLKRLDGLLADRFACTSPAFRVREALLSMRRTAFKLTTSPFLQPQIGDAWLATSKIARKAGYEQTAYSAALQAQGVYAPFAFLQQAKLSRAHGGAFKALIELENAMTPLLHEASNETLPRGVTRDRGLAKVRIRAHLLLCYEGANLRLSWWKLDGLLRLIGSIGMRLSLDTIKR